MTIELITELRSAAKTLRAPGGTSTDRISAELIERAALALESALQPPAPPAWEHAPTGYNYRAMDSDGHWSWFLREPYKEDFIGWKGWDDEDGVRDARGTAFYPDWEDTLSARPIAAQAVEAA